MKINKHNLPRVNEVGRILSQEGWVSFGKNAYNQVGDNCFEISSRLANLFGAKFFDSRREFKDFIFENHPRYKKSPINLIVRRPDNPSDFHLTIEAYGREYNYGPGTKEGFPIEIQIPLYRQD